MELRFLTRDRDAKKSRVAELTSRQHERKGKAESAELVQCRRDQEVLTSDISSFEVRPLLAQPASIPPFTPCADTRCCCVGQVQEKGIIKIQHAIQTELTVLESSQSMLKAAGRAWGDLLRKVDDTSSGPSRILGMG